MNLCLICFDALRLDHITEKIMPHTCKVLGRGQRWQGVTTSHTWTTPSVMAMLTGCDHAFRVGEAAMTGRPSIAGMLKRSHRSVAILGNLTPHLESVQWVFGDFDKVWHPHCMEGEPRSHAPMEVVIEQWRKHRAEDEGQWFEYIHFDEPHEPYAVDIGDPPTVDGPVADALRDGKFSAIMERATGELRIPTDAQHYLRKKYAAWCAATDRRAADFLTEISNDPNTVVAITTDHGDALGEDGVWGHGWMDMPEADPVYSIPGVQKVLLAVLSPDDRTWVRKHYGPRSNADIPRILLGELARRTVMRALPPDHERHKAELKAIGYL